MSSFTGNITIQKKKKTYNFHLKSHMQPRTTSLIKTKGAEHIYITHFYCRALSPAFWRKLISWNKTKITHLIRKMGIRLRHIHGMSSPEASLNHLCPLTSRFFFPFMFQKMQDLVFLDEFYETGLIYKTAAVLHQSFIFQQQRHTVSAHRSKMFHAST